VPRATVVSSRFLQKFPQEIPALHNFCTAAVGLALERRRVLRQSARHASVDVLSACAGKIAKPAVMPGSSRRDGATARSLAREDRTGQAWRMGPKYPAPAVDAGARWTAQAAGLAENALSRRCDAHHSELRRRSRSESNPAPLIRGSDTEGKPKTPHDATRPAPAGWNGQSRCLSLRWPQARRGRRREPEVRAGRQEGTGLWPPRGEDGGRFRRGSGAYATGAVCVAGADRALPSGAHRFSTAFPQMTPRFVLVFSPVSPIFLVICC